MQTKRFCNEQMRNDCALNFVRFFLGHSVHDSSPGQFISYLMLDNTSPGFLPGSNIISAGP